MGKENEEGQSWAQRMGREILGLELERVRVAREFWQGQD